MAWISVHIKRAFFLSKKGRCLDDVRQVGTSYRGSEELTKWGVTVCHRA